MPSRRQLVGRILAGLLLIATAAGCSRLGPHLHVDLDNTDGPRAVTVTVDSSGAGAADGDEVKVPARTGSAWGVPLGSTWEVKVDGAHVIGSGDRADLASPTPGRRQEVMVTIRIRPDGTVRLLEACLGEDYVDGRCTAP